MGAAGTPTFHTGSNGGGPPIPFPPNYETFVGPASSVTLSISSSVLLVFKNGVQQHKISGVPTEGEFDLTGVTLTIDLSIGDILDVYEWA